MKYLVTGIWPAVKVPSGGADAGAFNSPIFQIEVEAENPKEAVEYFRSLGVIQAQDECYLHTSLSVTIHVFASK